METSFPKKIIAARDSVFVLYAPRKTIYQTSAHPEKRMHQDNLTTWNLSLRTQGLKTPHPKLSLQIHRFRHSSFADALVANGAYSIVSATLEEVSLLSVRLSKT